MNLLLALFLTQTTPQMGLPISTPGVTSPYQTDVNNQTAFGIIDGHNHTPGQGALVPVAGLNINAPLPFNGNPAAAMGYLGLVDAGVGPSIPISLWNDGTNFWVEDELGNKIQLTCTGGICISLGGIDGGSLVLVNLTVTSTFNGPGGVGISGGCLTYTSGATYCFDGSGGLAETAVDGGRVILQSGGANYWLVGAVSTYSPNSLTIGQSVSADQGIGVGAGYPVNYDFAGAGNTTEVGVNLETTVPDGGGYILYTGEGAHYPLSVYYDGGLILRSWNSGLLEIGNQAINDGLSILPQPGGTGNVQMDALSMTNSNINITLAPAGSGQLVTTKPLGSSLGPLISGADAGFRSGTLERRPRSRTLDSLSRIYLAEILPAEGSTAPRSKTGVTAVCDGTCSSTPCICSSSSCSACTTIGVSNYGDTLGATVADTCTIGGNVHATPDIMESCEVGSSGLIYFNQQQLEYDAGWSGGVMTCECNSH